MWIQVRTIDGSQTRTIEDVSRKATIEELRERVWALFDVRPECQRLFYRGKQLENGYTLFDYDVGLNDIIQLLVRPDSSLPSTSKQNDVQAKPCSNNQPKVKKTARGGSSSQPSTSARTRLIDPGFGLYKVNELVDARDAGLGAWFEAHIHSVTRASDGHSRGKTPLKNGNSYKRTNGNVNHNSKENTNKLDNVPSTSNSDSVAADEDVIYHIEYDEYPESGTLEMNVKDLRPRARTTLKWNELNVGDVVMVNYNVENPGKRGFWYDAEITTLKTISRTKKEVRVKIFLGGSEGTLNDCRVVFVDEIFKIEKPGAHPISFADGKFLRKNDPECDLCGGDSDKNCHMCSCHKCGEKRDPNMQLLCDECNMAYHIYCLSPPLEKVPEEEYWYCPSCKTDSSEVVKAGERLKMSKKKAKMPSASTESRRDWGRGMACVGRTKECTIVPSNHYGPIPGIPVGSTWRFRVQVSEAGVHRPHVGGIHGRSNDGAYSLVLAGGFADEVDRGDEFTYTGSGGKNLAGNKRIGAPSADQTLTNMNRALALNCDAPLDDKIGAESRNWRAGKPVRVIRSFKGRKISKYAPEEGNRYDGIYKVVKYWPEISSSHGFLVWRYLLRRDDVEPAPWTSEGIERSRRLCLRLQETENTANKAGNESPVQELRQDVSKKIIDSIIEESQKVLQLEDESLDPEGKELSDQATAGPSVAGTDFSNIPGLLSIEHELQQDSEQADSPNVFEETESETEKCFPSADTCEKTVDETANLTDVSSTEQLDISDLETEILSKEAVEVKESDVLDSASSDSLSSKDFATAEEVAPAKPPRHLTPEPDIVASTKKPVPARPPPPTNFPPPRPPPPARPAPPPRKKKSELEFEALKTPDLDVPKDNITSDSLLTTNAVSESTAREPQPSLDLASATSGDKIVTAQENGKAPDGQTIAGEVMGPQRPRSNSGRELTDEEILASVMIKNLDTGEEIPLSLAEEKLPTGINPLTLHIMRRTKEYVSNDATQSDDEEKLQSQQADTDGGRLKQKTTQLKKFLGKSVKRAKHLAEEYGERAINKVKSVRDEVFHTDQDDPSSSDDEGMPYTRPVKFKAAHGFKGPYDFDQIKVVQDLSGEHMGAVWTMKFSHCGRLLASAGQDNIVRIWALKNAFDYFNNMRMKYNTEGRVSPSPSQESLSSSKSDTDTGVCSGTDEDPDDKNAPFRQRPFCKYKGHTADLLDLSWSKNYFLLSSSMDKTVRLWHISRRECLCCFQHIDFVTAIAFHPRDDRYFLSGSLDGKLRLWNIPDKKVALWNEVDGQTKLITAANFCQNGKYAVIGTYDGRCIFYDTEHLKYHTQIHVRSTRGRNKVGRKITGIEPLPGENKILVTSNDSRIRLYDLRDLSLSMKYKGYVNSSSQIKASFSHDFTYLVSGSEDKYVYIWSTYHDLSKFTSVRRDRNDFWEGIKAHNAVVTSAIFAPNPSLMLSSDIQSEKLEGTDKSEDAEALDSTSTGIVKTDNTEVLLSADFTGAIKVFINKRKTVP